MTRHGDPVIAHPDLLDPAARFGLAMNLNDYVELSTCRCEALCKCDKEGEDECSTRS